MKRLLLAILASFFSFSTATAEILHGFENPASGFPAAGISIVSLWAFSTTPGATMSVEVEVDGIYVVQLSCGGERIDVKNSYPQYGNALKSGCSTSVNWGNIPPGVHSLSWRMTGGGESKVVPQSVVSVRYGDARFVNDFDISQATSFIDKTMEEIVIANVKVRNSETGEWTTVELRFQFVVGSQGLQLSSAVTADEKNIKFVFDPGEDYQEIRGYVAESLDFLKREAGGSPTEFTIFAFSNLDLLVDAYMSFKKVPSEQREGIRDRWQNGVGEAGYEHAFLYLGGLWIKKTSLDRLGVVIHELAHIQQERLVGFPGLSQPGHTPDKVPFGGPIWLIEGVAQATADGMLGRKLKGSPRPPWWDQCNGITLQNMETRTGARSAEPCPLDLGLLAVNFMELPLDKLMGFWGKIRIEGDWKKGFYAQFGISVEQLYADFESYRATL